MRKNLLRIGWSKLFPKSLEVQFQFLVSSTEREKAWRAKQGNGFAREGEGIMSQRWWESRGSDESRRVDEEGVGVESKGWLGFREEGKGLGYFWENWENHFASLKGCNLFAAIGYKVITLPFYFAVFNLIPNTVKSLQGMTLHCKVIKLLIPNGH